MRVLVGVVRAALVLTAFTVVGVPALAAEPQQPGRLSVDALNRIKKQAEKPPPRLNINLGSQLLVPRFRTSVDQRVYVLPFKEQLGKELELTTLQRQSQDWDTRGLSSIFTPRGINVLQLSKALDRAMRRREARKARDQVGRELAEVEAARKD